MAAVGCFPGGTFDESDRGVAITRFGNDSEESVARCVAMRETLEETGLQIDAEQMIPFAIWVTPKARPKRFLTWFFVVEITEGLDTEIQIDGGEIIESRWITATEALVRA